MRAKEFVVEADSYSPPTLNVGDRILKGKFKNSPAEIKGFTKDKHNQPVLKTNRGEVQLFKPRVTKLMDKDVVEDADRSEEQASYMQGQCMILAVAINQYNPKRYLIGYIWEYNMSAGVPDMQMDDDEWEYLSPEEQEEISKDISRHSLVHAYVRDRETNEYIDARGRHTALPNLWGNLGVTRFEKFPGSARELINITAHGDWDEAAEEVSFKRGRPAFDSLAGPAGVKKALDYAIKYLEVVGPEQAKSPDVPQNQQGVAEDQNINLDIDYFMNEGCGIFAVAMALNEDNSQIYIISNKNGQSWSKSFPYEISHVFVSVSGKGQFDIRGKRSPEKMANDFNLNKEDYSIKGPFTPKEFFSKFMGDSDTKPLYGTSKDIKQVQQQIKSNLDEKLQGVAEDQLNEFDYEKHEKLINNYMKRLGYKKIGQGADAQVFANEKGPVIKILLPNTGNISTADNTFLAFYNYCQKNVNNPHLPKFINIQGQHHGMFEIDGEKFRQIAIERLREVSPGSELDNMVFDMMRGITKNKQPDPRYKNYMSFYKTLKEVMTLGKKLGFRNDIIDFNHSNVMQRNDVLVIIDPWAI